MKTVDSFRIHNLKCDPEPFAAVKAGDKTHEVRVNDRNYRVGDVLRLNEYDRGTLLFSSDFWEGVVTHVTTGYGLPHGLVVMSMRPIVWLRKTCASCALRFSTYDNAHTHCQECL